VSRDDGAGNGGIDFVVTEGNGGGSGGGGAAGARGEKFVDSYVVGDVFCGRWCVVFS